MRSLYALSFTAVLAAGCYDPKITSGSFGCFTTGSDQCPDGYACQAGACAGGNIPVSGSLTADGCCVKTAGGSSGGGGNPTINIPKSGPPYAGPHVDPMLDNVAACPDAQGSSSLEPNEGPSSAINDPNVTPDSTSTAKIIRLSICPSGNAPWSGKHDVDFFSIDNSSGPAMLTLQVQATYDISKGDLDIGIYDSNMNQLVVDGTAVSNACAAATITNKSSTSSGIYYIVVAGANNVDVNTYDLLIRTFTKSMPCPTS